MNSTLYGKTKHDQKCLLLTFFLMLGTKTEKFIQSTLYEETDEHYQNRVL